MIGREKRKRVSREMKEIFKPKPSFYTSP